MSRPLLPGDPHRIGRYRLRARLGRGGMGAVYLGEAPDGRLVALKMVRPEFAHDPGFRNRFRSEVNRAQQVPPFSTAEVLDADPDHDPPYLVVEYVDGPSLDTVLKERGPLQGSALHSLAIGTATALAAIHGAGVIHRDLKPANVLLPPGGIKVIDFGIARPQEATSHHTATGHMVGTIAYMAPERFEPADRHIVGFPADVFAWGVLIAHAAAGRTPFAAPTPPATAMRILTEPPELTGLPILLHGLVERALAKDPAARPTARELLDTLLAGAPPAAESATLLRSSAAPERSSDDAPRAWHRRKIVVATAAMLGAAALVVAGVLTGPLRLQQSAPPAAPAAAPAPPPPSAAAASRDGDAFAGKRRVRLRMSDIDRDLTLPIEGPAKAADDTGEDGVFVLVPAGVDYLIQSTTPDAFGAPRCVGVRLLPEGLLVLVATACDVTQETLFAFADTGAPDGPGYRIASAKYGAVQWNADRKVVFVAPLKTSADGLRFRLVDRGAR